MLGDAIEALIFILLADQKSLPDAIFFFSPFKDGRDFTFLLHV